MPVSGLGVRCLRVLVILGHALRNTDGAVALLVRPCPSGLSLSTPPSEPPSFTPSAPRSRSPGRLLVPSPLLATARSLPCPGPARSSEPSVRLTRARRRHVASEPPAEPTPLGWFSCASGVGGTWLTQTHPAQRHLLRAARPDLPDQVGPLFCTPVVPPPSPCCHTSRGDFMFMCVAIKSPILNPSRQPCDSGQPLDFSVAPSSPGE